MPEGAAGIWVAYHDDWSGMVVFRDEIDALRHAVEHSMQCLFVEYGDDLREAARRRYAR